MSTIASPTTIESANAVQTQGEQAIRELQHQLHLTKRKQLACRIAIGFCWFAFLSAMALAAIAAIDWMCEISIAWRAAWLCLMLTASVLGISFGYKRWIRGYTLSKTAVDTENQLSQFGQRLRTTIDYEQLMPPPAAASQSLLHSLHLESLRLAKNANWSTAVDMWPLFKTLFFTSAAAFLFVESLILFPEYRTAAARCLLLPLDYTTVSYSPDSATIRLGESVKITALVLGRPVRSAQVRYRTSDSTSEWSTVDLVGSKDLDESNANSRSEAEVSKTEGQIPKTDEKDHASEDAPTHSDGQSVGELKGELSVSLSDLQQDTEFEVLVGPRRLPLGHIRVLQPLTLDQAELQIVPPAYTHRPEETAKTLDLKVLEGSTVAFKLTFNRPVSEVSLTPLNTGTPVPPLILRDNLVSGTLQDLRNTISFTLSARTEDGMSLDLEQLNIRVSPDLKPRVKFIEPQEELVVTATTEVPMVVEADDDLGLHKVGILFQIASGPMQTLVEEDADGSIEPFRLVTLLLLENYSLTMQDAVTYYAFAEDNYFDNPRRTITPLRFIDIRPYQMDFEVAQSEGESNADEASNEGLATLEELITRQRQELSQAFQIEQQSEAQRDVVLRLVEAQQDILDATRSFSQGMEQLGAEETSLDEAASWMKQAVEKLDAADFQSAATAEQRALASLIRARENVRQKLRQSNSQSKKQQRQLDRKMQQSLRMPKKKEMDQQEQLAKTRQQLEDLAKRERDWSQQAQACCNNPSSSSGTPSPSEVAAAQEKIQSELADVQTQLEKMNGSNQTVRDQLEQVAESMEQGLEDLKSNDGAQAAKNSTRAADQLDSLSSYLNAMNARDFGERLEQAHKAAQQLAGRQKSITEELADEVKNSNDVRNSNTANEAPRIENANTDTMKGLSRDQQSLATETKMLADLLGSLQKDAVRESGDVQQRLEQAHAENPPKEIADGMSDTAEALQSGGAAVAIRGADQALERLQQLANSLSATRNEYSQPQLKELMAMEEQLAMLQEQMKQAQQQSNDPKEIDQKWKKLEARLNKVAESDQRLAEAMKQPRSNSNSQNDPRSPSIGQNSGSVQTPPKPESIAQPSASLGSVHQDPAGEFHSWSILRDYPRMKKVSQVLQTKIQEAILAGAVMDADQSVPSAYKDLVEKYYRALSDDLR